MIVEDQLAGDAARDDMLVLVDGLDREIGTATKRQAHEDGLLHRAFSVVLLREGVGAGESGGESDSESRTPELLLSRRAAGKYHSGGLWTNSCCSHPRAGEKLMDAAYRRVREELGCDAAGLREIAAFAYRAEFENGLCEHEYDHVIVGRCAGEPDPDPSETSELRWVDFETLAAELAGHPETFTAWAPMVLSMAMAQCERQGL